MMNQFTSIYGQLFCCSCPGGLAESVNCENRTGVFVTYPVLGSENGYAWVAGLLCLALVMVVVVISTSYCCKKTRQCTTENEMVSIIKFPLFSKKKHKKLQMETSNNAYENPMYKDDDVMQNETKVEIGLLSGSEESLDSAFVSPRRDDSLFYAEEPDCPAIKPMITENDSS